MPELLLKYDPIEDEQVWIAIRDPLYSLRGYPQIPIDRQTAQNLIEVLQAYLKKEAPVI